jgi:cysteine desulfurase/selenocysteine lyase
MTTRSEIPTNGVPGAGSDPGSLPGAIDEANLDRIARSLFAAIPGAATPAASIAAVPASIPGVPASYGARVAPSLDASSTDAPCLATAMLDAAFPQGSIPQGSSISPMAAGITPTAAGAVATQTALPEATAAAATLPAGIPYTPALPLNLDGLSGAMPRMFDDSAPRVAPTAGAPSYYFLTPTVASAAPSSATTSPQFARREFDVNEIRRDFPILQERVNGKQLVWLDNAATTQKPRAVIDRMVRYYEHEYSNVHRAAHTLAARSTDAYESARQKLQRFLGAGSPSEIIFARGTTEGVNLVAATYGRRYIGRGDEIVLSTLEHHSNIVPWQFIAEQVGAVIRVVPVTDRGEVMLGDFEKTLSTRTRFVALTHVSNALGTILPVREMIQMAHRRGARVLIDGAQAVSHFPVNVQELDADFYVMSGHKLFGPSAIGVVYGKKALLDDMPPWQGGGNMIQRVTFEKSTFADPPGRFEAGTAALGPAVGLGAAVDYLERIGMENVARHERELLAYATEALSRIPGVRLIGTAPEKAGVLSFVTDQIPAEEMGKVLDQDGIAVRAGHHCAQPTMDRFGLEATVRPSLALYNTHDEIDQLERAVRRALRK